MSKLPIEVVPNTNPPRFRWQQLVDTINGMKTVVYEEPMRPSLEAPLLQLLITVGKATAQLEVLDNKLKEMLKFKTWVHGYLDAHGVPERFPDGPHTKEGCRIGDRLDWLLKELEGARKKVEELTKQLNARSVDKQKKG